MRAGAMIAAASRPLYLSAVILVACVLLLIRPAPALAGGDVQQWLDRMARAVETLNYRGTLVHVRDDQVVTLGIVHRADENGVRERIYSIDGKPREVLRDGNRVRCLLPGGDQPHMLESYLSGRLLPVLPINRLTRPESAYRMKMAGRERVAGMMTRIVSIQPRDRFRYGYRLWLEENTGMLLRYALIDRDGRQLQQLSFTSIELGVPISDAELRPRMLNAPRVLTTRLDDAQSGIDRRHRRSSIAPRVPPGFQLANVGRGRGETGNVFEHLLFSDGLASFSIYVESGSGEAVTSRMETIGPVHIFIQQVGDRLFTVVGEVPVETVEFVGRQFRRMAESGSDR